MFIKQEGKRMARKNYMIEQDAEEWYNIAGKPEYNKAKKRLKKFLPEINEPWVSASFYNANEYFQEQKGREEKRNSKLQ